ncbi:MAG: type II and III secretion system protein family protein [Sphingomicrobium sp.]
MAALASATPASAQTAAISVADEVQPAGELMVPVNKSQVLRVDRPYTKALIGNPEIADVLPLTNQSVYLLGKKAGTTSLSLYDGRNMLIAVVDVVVGPDVIGLRRQLADIMPASQIGARISNDSIVLEGIVPNGPMADRAVQLAETYAPGKVINMLSVGSAQQVMLEVRFSEVKRSALKQFGLSSFLTGGGNNGFVGAIGGNAGVSGDGPPTLGAITGSFAVLQRTFNIAGLTVDATLDALERKGVITTLAEPMLVALSGETASFLAGGEFPVPVVQSGSSGGVGSGNNNGAFTVEWKPFGVSLGFTPTVLADGVINLVVVPEVSSIDPTASIVINNLTIPGLQTRRAKTVVELRDGESFALAGLLRKDFQDTVRQFPILGSIPIIGTLFRSTGFQHEETELVIIVTPRLVRPVRAGSMKAPTDLVTGPPEADLFLSGRTDTGVPAAPPPFSPPAARPVSVAPPTLAPGGTAENKPVGLEKDYGHVL